MKAVKKATEIVKLVNAVLFGVGIGLGVHRSVRETINVLAKDQEAVAKAKKAAK